MPPRPRQSNNGWSPPSATIVPNSSPPSTVPQSVVQQSPLRPSTTAPRNLASGRRPLDSPDAQAMLRLAVPTAGSVASQWGSFMPLRGQRLAPPDAQAEARTGMATPGSWASQWGALMPLGGPRSAATGPTGPNSSSFGNMVASNRWNSIGSDAEAEAMSEIQSLLDSLFPQYPMDQSGAGSSGSGSGTAAANVRALQQMLTDGSWRQAYGDMADSVNSSYGQMIGNVDSGLSDQLRMVNDTYGQLGDTVASGYDEIGRMNNDLYNQALAELDANMRSANADVTSGYNALDQSLLNLLTNPYESAPRASGIQADPVLENLLNSQGANVGEYQMANRLGQQQSVDSAREFNRLMDVAAANQAAGNAATQSDAAFGRATALSALRQAEAGARNSLSQQNTRAQQDLVLRRLEAQTGLSRDQLSAVLGLNQQASQERTGLNNDLLKALLGVSTAEAEQGISMWQQLVNLALSNNVPIGGLV